MMRSFVYGTFAILAIAAAVCPAAPKPAIVPAPGDWTVDMTFEHPQQIMLQRGGTRPQWFWYTIVTLTNRTNQDVDFYPKCDLMTDAFQIIPAGEDTLPSVFAQIKNRHKSRYPFLESLEKAGNRILQGEDNTKDIAIIWPDFDAQARSIKLFISGLSNETAVVDHPIKPGKVYLRKTLELSYGLRGDPVLRSYVKLDYKGRRWVMR
jgi:hypothetical protein